MELDVGTSIWGEATFKLKKANGKIEEITQKNILVNGFRSRFIQGSGLRNNMSYCHLGTGDTPTTKEDEGLSGSNLGFQTQKKDIDVATGEFPYWVGAEYFYPANHATGTIKEIVINGSTSHNGNVSARLVLDVPIEKGEFDELTIIYKRYMDFNGDFNPETDDYFEIRKTIENGNSDGTDFDWSVYLDWTSLYRFNLINRKSLFAYGSSNSPGPGTDRTGDWSYSGCLYDFYEFISSPNISTSHDSENYNWLQHELFLDTIEANIPDGGIAECSIGTHSTASQGTIMWPICVCRFAFDPPLKKDERHQLRLTFRFNVNWGV